jgi:hypothetical protein
MHTQKEKASSILSSKQMMLEKEESHGMEKDTSVCKAGTTTQQIE